jgi:hypothetical protein
MASRVEVRANRFKAESGHRTARRRTTRCTRASSSLLLKCGRLDGWQVVKVCSYQATVAGQPSRSLERSELSQRRTNPSSVSSSAIARTLTRRRGSSCARKPKSAASSVDASSESVA